MSLPKYATKAEVELALLLEDESILRCIGIWQGPPTREQWIRLLQTTKKLYEDYGQTGKEPREGRSSILGLIHPPGDDPRDGSVPSDYPSWVHIPSSARERAQTP